MKGMIMRAFRSASVAAWVAAGLALLASPALAAKCAKPGGGGGCKATIQEAVDAAVAGETVFVRPGRYTEGVNIPAGKDGLVIVGTGKTPSAARLDASGLGTVGFNVQSANVRVSNLTVRGALAGLVSDQQGTKVTRFVVLGADQYGVYIAGDNAVVSASRFKGTSSVAVMIMGNDALVRGVTAAMTAAGGVMVTGDRARVIGARVSNFTGVGVFVVGDEGVVRGCRARTFNGVGVQLISPAPSASVARVVRNRVAGGLGLGMFLSSLGPGLAAGNAVTDIFGTGAQVSCDSDCSAFRVSANVVDSTALGPGLIVNANAAGATVAANLASGNGSVGLAVDALGASVHHNVTAGNCLHGPVGCAGLSISGATNVLLRNVSSGNGMAGFDVAGTGMSLSHNRAVGNLHHGFAVGESGAASGTVLDANRAVNNVDYGFFLGSSSGTATLTNNVALRSSYSRYCNLPGAPALLTGNNFTVADDLCIP